VCIVRASNGETFDLGWLKNRRIVAFCGIGRPSSLIEMLESYGASLEKTVVFPDHHVYTAKDLADIDNERGSVEADAIVTTEKDLARLGSRAGDITNLHALRIRLEIEEHSRFADRIYSSYKATSSEQAAD
jgi:tetraacyldisaccharide 4'-kinase